MALFEDFEACWLLGKHSVHLMSLGIYTEDEDDLADEIQSIEDLLNGISDDEIDLEGRSVDSISNIIWEVVGNTNSYCAYATLIGITIQTYEESVVQCARETGVDLEVVRSYMSQDGFDDLMEQLDFSKTEIVKYINEEVTLRDLVKYIIANELSEYDALNAAFE